MEGEVKREVEDSRWSWYCQLSKAVFFGVFKQLSRPFPSSPPLFHQ